MKLTHSQAVAVGSSLFAAITGLFATLLSLYAAQQTKLKDDNRS